MTDSAARILIVDDDENIRDTLSRVLTLRGFEAATASDGAQALDRALEWQPDLIIADVRMPGMDGFELCRQVRASAELEGVMLLMLTGHADTASVVTGFELGADDYVAKPVSTDLMLARVGSLLRLKRRHDELQAARADAARRHAETEENFQQLLALLSQLVDLGIPGAADRGMRRAALAGALAERFEIPEALRPDLLLAARLFEIGRLADPDRQAGAMSAADGWKTTARSVAILRFVPSFNGVGEVLSAVYENWDGSGVPQHRQLGQIPLRSRILRTLVDFMAEQEHTGNGNGHDAAMARLRERTGTLYDPAVLNQLEGLLGENAGASYRLARRCVAVEDLVPGMVLAEDLYTNGGVKLMARGSAVGSGTLQLILDRHSADPIIGGAWVRLDG
jgi:response regulator RpfG family c-di-GMP phosphodiesterase